MGMKKRSKVNAEFSMSSLTDIIFLLLIFFMLTSSMVVPNALNLQLPGQAKKNRPSQPPVPPSTVTIKKNGTYLLNGSPAKKSTIEKEIRNAKKRSKKVSVVVNPNADAPNESVVAILDMAFRLQINAIMTDPR